MLLDALAALVNARAVLAQQPAEAAGRRPDPPPGQNVRGTRPPADVPEKVVWEGLGRLQMDRHPSVLRPSEPRYVHAQVIQPAPPPPPIGASARQWVFEQEMMPRVILSPAPEAAGDVDRSLPPFSVAVGGADVPLREWLLEAGGWRFRLRFDSVEHVLVNDRASSWKASMDVVAYGEDLEAQL